MLPEDRKSLGNGGLLPEEALAKAEVKNERALQNQIVSLLRLKGIEPLWHRTDKRSSATIGWPDITFAGHSKSFSHVSETTYKTTDLYFACGWEIKFGNGQLSEEQERLHIRLSTPPNAWRVKVIRSVDEAIAELKDLGIK